MAKPKPLKDLGGKFEPLKPDDGGLSAYKKATDKRFADIETLTRAILYVGIISLVGVIVTTIGVFIDQLRFNNQTYNQQNTNDQTQIRLLQDEVNRLKAKK